MNESTHEYMQPRVGPVAPMPDGTELVPIPFGRYIIVKPETVNGDRRTSGGIVIPETVRTMDSFPNRGHITHAGPDCTRVSVGDLVAFPVGSGRAFDATGVRVLSEDDLYFKLEPAAAAS